MKRNTWIVAVATTSLAVTGATGALARGGHHQRGEGHGKGKVGAYDLAKPSSPSYSKGSRLIQLPGDGVYPEGIALDGRGSLFSGSSQQGTIFRSTRGSTPAEIFLAAGSDGRTSAIGMKVDPSGRLIVAGGALGDVFVYDTNTKALLAKLDNTKAANQTFLNDVAVGPNGDVYVTDSTDPVIYRVPAATLANPQGATAPERWLELAGTPFAYQPGFNANGIVATRDGKYLLVVQTNTGKLFRVEVATKQVTEVDLQGRPLTGGDGLILSCRKLWVVRSGQVDVLKMKRDFTVARFSRTITDPSFDSPTTGALAGERLYVVNSQFGRLFATPPQPAVLPFTISVVKTRGDHGHGRD